MLRDAVTGDWIGTFSGHKGAVWSTRLNSSLNRAVTASGDFSCKLWDATNGDCLHTWEQKHVVRAAVFTQDETAIWVGGSMSPGICIYDLVNYDKEPMTMPENVRVTHLVSLADPNLIAAAGRETGVRIWDRRSLECVRTLPTDHKLSSLSLSFDGQVMTATTGHHLVFWDTNTLEQIKTIHVNRETHCAATALMPKLRRVVTGGPSNGDVHVYDFDSGAELATMRGHHGTCSCVAIAPMGDTFASGSDDATVRIWSFA